MVLSSSVPAFAGTRKYSKPWNLSLNNAAFAVCWCGSPGLQNADSDDIGSSRRRLGLPDCRPRPVLAGARRCRRRRGSGAVPPRSSPSPCARRGGGDRPRRRLAAGARIKSRPAAYDRRRRLQQRRQPPRPPSRSGDEAAPPTGLTVIASGAMRLRLYRQSVGGQRASPPPRARDPITSIDRCRHVPTPHNLAALVCARVRLLRPRLADGPGSCLTVWSGC